MPASITLTRHAGQPVANQHSWPVRIVASGTEIAPEIFVYAVGQADAPLPGDRFECVASVPQMHELPLVAPLPSGPTEQIPYYRRAEAAFVARSAEEADNLWRTIQLQVRDLVRNWNAGLVLQQVDAVVITDTTVIE